MSDARIAVFDEDGKYLYFTASTDIGLATGGLDMSSDERSGDAQRLRRRCSSKDLPSPLAPESDEEKDAKKDGDKKDEDAGEERRTPEGQGRQGREAEKRSPSSCKIDFDGIGQRILALPIPARNYIGMLAGKAGVLFLAEGPAVVAAARRRRPQP